MENGISVGLLGIVRDVTEQKKAEEAILKARVSEDANRAKSEFLASMSHELRTPLNSIIGFSDLLLEGLFGELNGRQKHYLENISMSGKYLMRLINDILDLSKVEAGKMELDVETFGVSDTIENVLKLIDPLALKKNISIDLDIKRGFLPPLEADLTRFKQILYNLISNAIKFTPEEGSITISASRAGDMLNFCIRDTGIGISKEDHKNLFQSFKQLDSAGKYRYEGSGLGLLLSRKFVEMHGGSIRVESKEGEGSSFIFELPLKRGKPLENS